MRASAVAPIGALCHEFRVLLPILDEHFADMDGVVFPHLIMSDVVRWMAAKEHDVEMCTAMRSWLEVAYVSGDGDERNLIGVSGVEMLPDPSEAGAGLRSLLSPALRDVDRGFNPEILPYLALPPGWRTLLAPDYEDVWFDSTLIGIVG